MGTNTNIETYSSTQQNGAELGLLTLAKATFLSFLASHARFLELTESVEPDFPGAELKCN